MPPKIIAAGAKRQTNSLSSWLKPSNSRPQKRARTESTSNSMAQCDETSKKAKTDAVTDDCTTDDATQEASSPKSNSDKNAKPTSLNIIEEIGDIFSAPKNTLIIHACNCQGSWGGGIALAFKKHYPRAFKVYAAQCKASSASELLGTALLIAPTKDTLNKGSGSSSKDTHFIGCLFTSNYFGKRKDSPSKILSATGPSMEDLMQQVKDWNSSHADAEKIGEVRMCKINSGLFAVPWRKTVDVLGSLKVAEGDVNEIRVLEREE